MAEVGVNFIDMRTACNIHKIKNGIKQQFFNKPDKIDVTERIQVVSPDFISFVMPAARGNSLFMAKCSDHYNKLKAVYFIWTKDKKLTTLVQFVQDFSSCLPDFASNTYVPMAAVSTSPTAIATKARPR